MQDFVIAELRIKWIMSTKFLAQYMAPCTALFVKGIHILKLMVDENLKNKYVKIEIIIFTFNI